MALLFSDDQIKSLTEGMLAAPEAITNAQNDKAAAIAGQAEIGEKDQGNTVYTNNWKNIIDRYHDELKYLNGVQKSAYDTNLIDPAGRQSPGNVHFPISPPWVNFQPKIIDSINGNPTSAWTQTEQEAISRANPLISLLKTGFTDGATNTTTDAGFIVDEVDLDSAAGIAVGNRMIFISGSNYLYGTVASLTGLTVKINLILSNAGFAGISMGASARNFHPGWSLTQRDNGVGAGVGDSAYMAGLKAAIDVPINDWETRLNAEKSALTANDALDPEKTQIQAALGVVNGHLGTINTWQGFPAIGVGSSRFGTNLPPLETALANRPGQFGARIGEINAALGSAAQAGDGTFSGSGNYFKLFDNLNTRLNKAGGTLTSFYGAGLGITLFDQIATNLQNTLDRDTATFIVKKFTANGDGTNAVVLEDVTGLSVGQAVKIMSSTQPVLSLSIDFISGNSVILSGVVSGDYLVDDVARLVKQN